MTFDASPTVPGTKSSVASAELGRYPDWQLAIPTPVVIAFAMLMIFTVEAVLGAQPGSQPPAPKAPPTIKKPVPATSAFGGILDNWPADRHLIFMLYDTFDALKLPGWTAIPNDKLRELQKAQQELARLQINRDGAITELEVTGKLGDRCQFEIMLFLRVASFTPEQKSARIDLRLAEAQIAQLELKSTQTMNTVPYSIERQLDGHYRLLLQQDGDMVCRLQGFCEIEKTANAQNRLKLTLPSAPVKRVKLATDDEVIVAKQGRSDQNALAATSNRREINPLLRGDESIDLVWQTTRDARDRFAAAATVNADIRATLTNGRIDTKADVLIDLPIETNEIIFFFPTEQKLQQIEAWDRRSARERPLALGAPVVDEITVNNEQPRRRAKISFLEPCSGPLRLKISLDHDPWSESEEFSVGMLEFANATPQIGQLYLYADSPYDLALTPEAKARSLPSAQWPRAIPREGLRNAFSLLGQPARIRGKATRTAAKITVDHASNVTFQQDFAYVETTLQAAVRRVPLDRLVAVLPAGMEQVRISSPAILLEDEPLPPTDGKPGVPQRRRLRLAELTDKVILKITGRIPLTVNKPSSLALPTIEQTAEERGQLQINIGPEYRMEDESQFTRGLEPQNMLSGVPLPLTTPSSRNMSSPSVAYAIVDRQPILGFSLKKPPIKQTVAGEMRLSIDSKQIEYRGLLRFTSDLAPMSAIQLTKLVDFPIQIDSADNIRTTPLKPGPNTWSLITPATHVEVRFHATLDLSPTTSSATIPVGLWEPTQTEAINWKIDCWCHRDRDIVLPAAFIHTAPLTSDPIREDLQRKFHGKMIGSLANSKLTLTTNPTPERLFPRARLIEEFLLPENSRLGSLRISLAGDGGQRLTIFIPTTVTPLQFWLNGKIATVRSLGNQRVQLDKPADGKIAMLQIDYEATLGPVRGAGVTDLTIPILENAVECRTHWILHLPHHQTPWSLSPGTQPQLLWAWPFFGLQPTPAIAPTELKRPFRDFPNPPWLLESDEGYGRVWIFSDWGENNALRLFLFEDVLGIGVFSSGAVVIGLLLRHLRSGWRELVLSSVAVGFLVGYFLYPTSIRWVLLYAQWGVLVIILAELMRQRRRKSTTQSTTILQNAPYGSVTQMTMRGLSQTGTRLGSTIDAPPSMS